MYTIINGKIKKLQVHGINKRTTTYNVHVYIIVLNKKMKWLGPINQSIKNLTLKKKIIQRIKFNTK